MDNLDRDTRRAMMLGYGVHYGAYKADHPHTKEAEPQPEPDPKEYGKCRYCGKLFPRKGKKYRKLYCDDECRMRYSSNRKIEINTK